jgi:spectinomycin phosphotransferase
VYRVATGDVETCFVKLRRGDFAEAAVRVPHLLHKSGVTHLIAPLPTRAGRLWTTAEEYKVIVYPFVEGEDGYTIPLSDQQCTELGRALKALHTATLPSDVLHLIQREAYSPYWRELVSGFQSRAEQCTFDDPIAAELAAFIRRRRSEIDELLRYAGQSAMVLQRRSLPYVVCHADIHAGNVHIARDGRLYVVDWDTLTMAPKERDLMAVGGGLLRGRHTPAQEAAFFYRGYGQAYIDLMAVAYYRCERIVQDIAAYCEQVLLTEGDSPDRVQGVQQLTNQFRPGEVVDIAFATIAQIPPDEG